MNETELKQKAEEIRKERSRIQHREPEPEKLKASLSAKTMHIRILRMLKLLPDLDKAIKDALEKNGIPGGYSLEAVRLLLAVYDEADRFMPFDWEEPGSDFSISR
ncbi:hypothetical protein GTL21_002371 [Salmonella enterica]|nr:hypothetical protein [Salmonella enterica]HBM0098396.1 hypothetical protein [Salmonella enterica subsp. enterica serovar Blitta]